VLPVENPDGLTLHPGRAYLDEQIEIFNPTDGVHPYYFWNNTAFPNRPGTRFMYPMTLGSDHNGVEFFSWPLHEGRDMTWLKNYPGPTSVFGYQVDFDFFGAYDVDRDYGIVQFADHTKVPGKKAWTWGESDSGLAAQAVLTDEDGPYIEVQSGPLQTQADFEMLAPGQRVAWQEFWYPAAGLGDGFEYANLDAVVQRRAAADSGAGGTEGAAVGAPAGDEFRVMPTRDLPGARLSIAREGETIASESFDMRAGVAVSLTAPIAATEPVDIELTDGDGQTVLRYRSPLEIPDRQAPVRTTDDAGNDPNLLFERAFAFDKQGDRVRARAGYARILAIDPDHAPTHVAIGVLDAEAGLSGAALGHFDRAVELAPGDGMGWYLRAATRLRLDDLMGAAEDADKASRLTGTVALGHDLIGRVRMREGGFQAAIEAFQAAQAAGGAEIRVAEHLMLATYASGDAFEAARMANQSIAAGTVRLVPHAVSALTEADLTLTERAERFARRTGEWVGEPEFAYLELVFRFAHLGLLDEADALLGAVGTESANGARPLPLYVRAWLARVRGERGRALIDELLPLAMAAGVPADYVFPAHTEMIAVLGNALEADPEDAPAHLYLGNLYAGLGRVDEAVEHWESAVRLDPSLSVAHRNLGLTSWKRDNDLTAAVERYRAAIEARPDDQTLYRDLAGVLIDQGQAARAIEVLENTPADAERRADATVLLARTYTDVGRYDDAIALLESTTFTNREGDAGTGQIFYRAHVERGVARMENGESEAALADFEAALTYPANLNAGRSHEPREARAEYWRGMALQALERTEEARSAWQTCVDGVAAGTEQEEHIALCRIRLSGLR